MALKLNKNNLHHAYFLAGKREELKDELTAFIENELNVKTIGNPDFLYQEFETLGVDDAREINQRQEKSGFGEGSRIFIIAFNFITTEAQNALLKMFEEPSSDTHFFIIAPTSAVLLPTLKSRLHVVSSIHREVNTEIIKFLRASTDERLKLMERFKDAENETKKSELLAFVGAIESELSKDRKKDVKVFEELYTLKRFLLARSPSVKMIAEYLALRLPQI